MVVLNKNLN